MFQAKGTVCVKALRQNPPWHVRIARSVWLEQSEQGREQEVGQGMLGRSHRVLWVAVRSSPIPEGNGEPWKDLGKGGA